MSERLKFSDDHLWVRVDGDQAHVGISSYLQNRLGEIKSIQLPEEGQEVTRGEPLGELEAANEVHELVAPITGLVVAINSALEDHPTLVNEDPYEEGWLIEIEVRDDDELDELLEQDEYEELLSEEADEDDEDEDEVDEDEGREDDDEREDEDED
jgi:glycine cleavage system H protein